MRKANYNNPNKAADKAFTQAINFEAMNLPQPNEPFNTSDAIYVPYGITGGYYNRYPAFLLELYNGSSTHASIIEHKANFILGEGLMIGKDEPVEIKVNAGDTFNEFLNKVILDFLIFNYFCVEVVYDRLNRPVELHHVPAQKIRTNKSKNMFWFDEHSWMYSNSQTTFTRWTEGKGDGTSKLFYYDGYSPSITNTYPRPEYHASITSIKTDVEINNFNLNNITNHFSVSSLISFYMGSGVTDDIKKKTLEDIKNTYSGANGNKILLDFQPQGGKGATVQPLTAGDWDKAYTLIKESVTSDIMIGHMVNSPELFGIQVPGKLGGGNELEVSFEIFKNIYIRNRRNKLLAAFKDLFIENGFVKGDLSFKDVSLFNNDLSEAMKEKIMTLNELRAEKGFAPLPDGDQLLGQIITSKSSGNTTFADEKKKLVATHLTEEDYEKIKDFGEASTEFEFIDEGEAITDQEHFNLVALKFSDSEDIANYLLKNGKGIKSLSDLKDAIQRDLGIDISTSDLTNTLNDLTKAGVIKSIVTGDKVNIKNPGEPDTSVQVMYQYTVRPGLGEPIIATTRPFCAKLINNNRVYTREEIQQMSAIFSYDIFKYAGGFYHDPESGETTPFCRHQFKAIIAVKRKK